MPRKGRSNEEIIHALHQVEGGEKVAEVCRRLGVSEQTFYRWKKQFAGLGLSDLHGGFQFRLFVSLCEDWSYRKYEREREE